MEEEKEGNEVKEGTNAKVEAYISGDYFFIACRYWRFYIFYTNRKLGIVYSLHRHIFHFTIVNEKTYEYRKIARRFIGELFCYAFFSSSFVFSVAK